MQPLENLFDHFLSNVPIILYSGPRIMRESFLNTFSFYLGEHHTLSPANRLHIVEEEVWQYRRNIHYRGLAHLEKVLHEKFILSSKCHFCCMMLWQISLFANRENSSFFKFILDYIKKQKGEHTKLTHCSEQRPMHKLYCVLQFIKVFNNSEHA